MAASDAGRGVLYLPDVLPPANFLVAVRCVACPGTLRLFLLRLFTQWHWSQIGQTISHASRNEDCRARLPDSGGRAVSYRIPKWLNRRLHLRRCGVSFD